MNKIIFQYIEKNCQNNTIVPFLKNMLGTVTWGPYIITIFKDYTLIAFKVQLQGKWHINVCFTTVSPPLVTTGLYL